MSARVIFRADGGPAIGGGHVMRSLALAAAFADHGWKVGFAASAETLKSMPQLSASPYDKLSLPDDSADEAAAMAAQWPQGCDLLVVDHYGRDAALERACRPWAREILVIDDLADRQHDADLLADSGAQSASAYEALVPSRCRVLAGPAYAIVHPNFLLAREAALPRRDGRAVARILVAFGQMDPDNATALALDAIELAGFTGAVDVVLGQSAPHLAAIRRRAKGRTTLHVNAATMPALMATSDLAIGAGGVTAFERCCLGLPAIAIEIAANQRGVIAQLAGKSALASAGAQSAVTKEQLAEMLRTLLADAGARKAMAAAGAALVDGKGSVRIYLAAIAEEKSKRGQPVGTRLAEASDEAWLLGLQSAPETRRYANNPAVPSAAEHAVWFNRTRSDPARLLLIVEVAGKAAGMLRLDRGPEDITVSIAVAPEFQRDGIGRAALRLASRIAPGRILRAQVHRDNAASLALFSAEGYRHDGGDSYRREPQ